LFRAMPVPPPPGCCGAQGASSSPAPWRCVASSPRTRSSSRPVRPARARSSPARLLEHLGAGLQPVPQLVPLAGRRMSVSWRYCPMPGSGLVVSGRTSPIPGSRRIR